MTLLAFEVSEHVSGDILISQLTVREHLELFARIMGLDLDVEGAVQLGLADKLDAPVHTLSGGQKRKVIHIS